MELLASLERLGAATPTSLDLPENLTYARYEALLVALGRAHRTVAFMIGDALNQGEQKYGQKYHQAAEALNMTEETLMNYASICRRIPRERRKPELPFSVHALVAKLPPTEQTQWLEKAVKHDWKRRELREKLHPHHNSSENSHSGVRSEATLEEAARWLVDSAEAMGDGFLVRDSAFKALCSALGVEA